MRDDTPSRTAAWVAAARGMGTLLPESIRLADDPYGVAFASPRLAKLLARGPTAIAQLPGFKTWIVYMQVRTRVLDDVVRAFVQRGGRQLVVLGAGYDCRALRLRELDRSTVFEVDHPATQGHKRAVLAKLGAESPARYLAWDFETRPLEDLPDALAEAGHDPEQRTLTIWEGVTMYLAEPQIDASLRAIRAWSAPRSELGMTYFATSRLAKPSLATRAIRAVVARIGEPWRFGWDPAALPEYLEDRGWELADDISTPEAARGLFPDELAAKVGRADSHIAIAEVAVGPPRS